MGMTSEEHDEVDVLICGAGSAGLTCALWLAIYNERFHQGPGSRPIKYCVLDRRTGPLEIGQADGVQCRTVEIFESLGLDHLILNEAYWVNEVTFWSSSAADASSSDDDDNKEERKEKEKEKPRPIKRTGRTADTEPGLSHTQHVILGQARLNQLLIEKTRALGGVEVQYGWEVTEVQVEKEKAAEAPQSCGFPVRVRAIREDGQQKVFHAKYCLGSDGAHSVMRRQLGISMDGDSTNAVWGVMDVFTRTNFPDIRKKATIRADAGSVLLIPREGDSMVRFYVETPPDTDAKKLTLHELHEKARAIFYPFELEFAHTFWWSSFSIGQRLARSMTDSLRAFLAGDACHTHSPKAGQGMNASLQDGYNFGWKVASVLSGHADVRLLETYVEERYKFAKSLIEFDAHWSKMFSSEQGEAKKTPPEAFRAAFIQSGKFTAGMAGHCDDSLITASALSTQDRATELVVGMRMPSAQLVRFNDSKPVQLQGRLRSDGRWRIIIFGGDVGTGNAIDSVNKIGEYLDSDEAPVRTFTPSGSDLASLIETLVVLRGDRTQVELDQFHPFFTPVEGELRIKNTAKIFFDDASWNHGNGNAYEKLGIDSRRGCIAVVRPDQFVSAVFTLEDHEKLSLFFAGFMHRH